MAPQFCRRGMARWGWPGCCRFFFSSFPFGVEPPVVLKVLRRPFHFRILFGDLGPLSLRRGDGLPFLKIGLPPPRTKRSNRDFFPITLFFACIALKPQRGGEVFGKSQSAFRSNWVCLPLLALDNISGAVTHFFFFL